MSEITSAFGNNVLNYSSDNSTYSSVDTNTSSPLVLLLLLRLLLLYCVHRLTHLTVGVQHRFVSYWYEELNISSDTRILIYSLSHLQPYQYLYAIVVKPIYYINIIPTPGVPRLRTSTAEKRLDPQGQTLQWDDVFSQNSLFLDPQPT